MQTFEILYKRTNTGAIQQWCMEVDGNKTRSISGQVGGKLVTSSWKECEGTNLGKSNERTPEQQAVADVESYYRKKKDSGYKTVIDDVDIKTFFKPMLAKEFGNYSDKIKYPVFIQPKYDGGRCVITKEGMFTRNGKQYVSCPHIHQELLPIFLVYPDAVFDGELYNHDLKYDFNKIMSLAKTLLPTEQDLEESKKLIKFYCYDFYGENMLFSERMEFLNNLPKLNSVVIVPTEIAQSKEAVDKYHCDYLEEGYEGTMIRTNAKYQNKRTSDLLKYKTFLDDEFILVDIEEGKGNWSGYAKSARLKMKDGTEFSAGVCGTQEFCRDVLLNKDRYIGKITTVNFGNYTPDGIPRFGRVKELDRIDK